MTKKDVKDVNNINSESAGCVPEAVRGAKSAGNHSDLSCWAKRESQKIFTQLIDTPPVTPDYMEVWHYELVKDADGVLFLLDLASQDSIEVLEAILAKLREKKIELIPEEQTIPADSPFFLRRAIIVANKSAPPGRGKFLSIEKSS